MDDSGFKKHMLIAMLVSLELLSISIILAATDNALHVVTGYLGINFPLYLDSVGDTLVMGFMTAFVLLRSWYHYVLTDQIDDIYEENRVLIGRVKSAMIHIVVFTIVYFLSDYNAFIRLINFASETLTK